MDIMKENKRFVLDWQDDIGLSEDNAEKMGLAAYYVTMFSGLLNKDGDSWAQFLCNFALDTSAYDSKYGEELSMLFCTYSDKELKKEVEQTKKLMSHFNGDNALADTISKLEKRDENTIAGLQKTCSDLKKKIDVNNPSSIALYNRSYQALENICDEADFLSDATTLYMQVEKGVANATGALEKLYTIAEVTGYAKEFQNQDEFAVNTQLDFVLNSDSESIMSGIMKEGIKSYASTLQTNVVTYSALRYLEENYGDLIFDAADLSSSLIMEANLMLIAWNIASSLIPFYSNGIEEADSFILSMYASVFQADAFLSYQSIRNATFEDEKKINAEELYKVSKSCYTYLKSCYITRAAALGSLTDETKKSIPRVIKEQNGINEEIARYLVQLKNADTTNTKGCYGFLPADNDAYLNKYDGEALLKIAENPRMQISLDNEYISQELGKHYTDLLCDEGERSEAVFFSENDSYFEFGMYYYMSEEEYEELIADGASPSVPRFQMKAYVDKKTHTVTDDIGTPEWTIN